MGKASDIRNYHDSADEIERLHRHLKERFVDYAAQIQKFIEDLEDEEIEELSEYLRYLMGNHVSENVSISVSMDRVKAAFLLFSKLTDNCCSDTVLSYLESVEFGWHENNEYYLSNSCLRRCLYSPEGHCKMVSKLDSMELVGEYLNKIYEIFFDEEYGSIILFIFSYCLASLFSSVLNQYGIFVPFFLQITCDRNSTLYQLITEIIEICDVNSGLLQNCNKLNRDYRYCGYTSQIYFPTTSTAKDIEELIGNFRDRPVIIAGHENERNYNALLREVANVPIKKRNLALKDRFNLMPVFVSPMIKSSFDNVFDMDLTDVEISEDYLVSVKRNKQVLAAWVLELITGERNVYQPIRRNGQRPPIKKNLLVREIGSYMNSVSQRYPSLLLKNSQNVGFLNFFFKQFLGIFSKFCNISSDEKFECFIQGKENLQQSKEEIVSMLADLSEKRLVELHHRYLPAPTGVGLKDKAAIRLAKQIEKEYRTLGVQIRVTSAEMKEDRYIFTVDTLSRTKDTDVSKNADTIQKRLKK